MAGPNPASLPSLGSLFNDPVTGGVRNPAPLPSLSSLLGGSGSTSTHVLTASAGSFVLTGVSATLKTTRKITASAGSFAWTGVSATLTYSNSPASGVESAAPLPSMSSLFVRPAGSYLMRVDPGAFVVTGKTANLAKGISFAVAPGSFVVTGASALSDYQIGASPGAFTISGQTAALTKVNLGITALPGSFVVTFRDAFLRAEIAGQFTLACGAGSFTVTGQTAGYNRSNVLQCAPGSFTVLGRSATLSNGGTRVGIWTLITHAHTTWQ